MEQPIYEENFSKSYVNPNNLLYIMDQIREVHSAEKGWVVGEPVITRKNEDGTINFYVPLKKYSVEKISGRSL